MPRSSLSQAFHQGLRELGYVEGQNLSIEGRWADGKPERLPDLAADLVRLKVDVIVARDSSSGRQAGHHHHPHRHVAFQRPVGTGLVASLARPGGNVTGLAFLSEELGGKWIELLKAAFPRVSRVAVLWHPASAGQGQLTTTDAAARSLGVHLHALKVERADELSAAFAEAGKNRAEALIVSSSAFFYQHRRSLVDLAAKVRLPTMYHHKDFVVESGGLMSYGPNLHDVFRRAASYVDRILKGAKPAELPVEQPTKFEFVINLKTAKAIGVTIPPVGAGANGRNHRVIVHRLLLESGPKPHAAHRHRGD